MSHFTMSFLPAVRLMAARCSLASRLHLQQLVTLRLALGASRALTTLPSNIGRCPQPDLTMSQFTQQVRYYAKNIKKEKKGKGGKGGKSAKPKVSLTDAELNDVINYTKLCHQMDLAVESLKVEFVEQLTVRTNAGVLNQMTVDTPDGRFPLIQLGQVAQKTPQLVVINLSVNPQYMNDVKTAMTNSGLGLNPQQDGTTLFVPLPKVTKELRENLSKGAKMLCTKCKDKLKDVHNAFMRDLKKQKDAHSQDLIHTVQEYIDQAMWDYVKQVEDMTATKQKELLQES